MRIVCADSVLTWSSTEASHCRCYWSVLFCENAWCSNYVWMQEMIWKSKDLLKQLKNTTLPILWRHCMMSCISLITATVAMAKWWGSLAYQIWDKYNYAKLLWLCSLVIYLYSPYLSIVVLCYHSYDDLHSFSETLLLVFSRNHGDNRYGILSSAAHCYLLRDNLYIFWYNQQGH